MKSGTFKIETLGCKINQYDSRRLREMLESSGMKCLDDNDLQPEVWIVNTCSVTHVADRKARKLIRHIQRGQPEATVYVTGCYAATQKEALERACTVDGIYGFEQWDEMIMHVCADAKPEPGMALKDDFGISDFTGRSRAFIKVQDGCDSFCTYCIVPYARGKPRSSPLQDSLSEGVKMIRAGFHELVLSGVHLGLYGKDLPGTLELADLVEKFSELDQKVRIRLSSLEGPEVSDGLLRAVSHPNVCPHLHIPLQSGDPGVLRKMGRRYGPGEFYEVLEKVRDALPEPAVSTDVMVGFPGETDRAFQNTLDFCEKAGFSRIHVFNYSPRPQTPAYDMKPEVDSKTAKGRSRALLELAERLQEEWRTKFVGRPVRVLFEDADSDGYMHGYSDRYIKVRAPLDQQVLGQLSVSILENNEEIKS